MGLFSDMGKFGLGDYENTKVIEHENHNAVSPNRDNAQQETEVDPVEREKEALYDKHYVCPVCDLSFQTKFIRVGKVKMTGKDTDLRPIYDGIDPIKYDVITCDKCGYSALTRYFGKLSTRQMKEIYDNIGSHFQGIDNTVDLYTYDDAIARYKLALLTSVVKKAKNSERAYTSMKLAWVLRGKRMTLKRGDEGNKELYMNELECIKNAYDGFCAAISSEPFPIAGMDENTLQYVMADMARRLKKYNDAVKLLGGIITSKNVSPRLKEQALTLKELIKEEIKKGNTVGSL